MLLTVYCVQTPGNNTRLAVCGILYPIYNVYPLIILGLITIWWKQKLHKSSTKPPRKTTKLSRRPWILTEISSLNFRSLLELFVIFSWITYEGFTTCLRRIKLLWACHDVFITQTPTGYSWHVLNYFIKAAWRGRIGYESSCRGCISFLLMRGLLVYLVYFLVNCYVRSRLA